MKPTTTRWITWGFVVIGAICSLLLIKNYLSKPIRTSIKIEVEMPEPPPIPASTNHMKEEIKEEIAAEIKDFLQSGFYDQEETLENITDMYHDEIWDREWAKETIDSLYQVRLQEQATWPAKTDFDRLALVFDLLNKEKILALHNAGYTKQDGEGDAEQLFQNLQEEDEIKIAGYCFYHGQDIERAIDGGGLFLAYGDFENNDIKAKAIGHKIVAALNENGFETEWNGSVQDRIFIKQFKWQKRFGNENSSYEHALELIRGNKQ